MTAMDAVIYTSARKGAEEVVRRGVRDHVVWFDREETEQVRREGISGIRHATGTRIQERAIAHENTVIGTPRHASIGRGKTMLSE
jgi:hypothetical protein